MKFVFVYGTLKRGGPLNQVLSRVGASFMKGAKVEGYTLWSVDGVFPAMLPEKDGVVKGEIWAVPDSAMDLLDRIEISYDRKVLLTSDHEAVNTYVWRGWADPWMQPHGEEWDTKTVPPPSRYSAFIGR